MPAISAFACSCVTPSASCAIVTMLVRATSSGAAVVKPSGVQMSAVMNGGGNPLGITPITVYGSPSSCTVRPSTPGSPPKRRCQAP